VAGGEDMAVALPLCDDVFANDIFEMSFYVNTPFANNSSLAQFTTLAKYVSIRFLIDISFPKRREWRDLCY
jgi:hypothetical protein